MKLNIRGLNVRKPFCLQTIHLIVDSLPFILIQDESGLYKERGLMFPAWLSRLVYVGEIQYEAS